MFIKEDSDVSENIIYEIVSDLEKWCIVFNEFMETFFIYFKFLLVFILFSLGILTLLKLRGVYFDIRFKNKDLNEDPLRKERLSIGITYIFLGFGILFNYLIYFLIWALDPLPDRFIFKFINFHGGIDPERMNRIENIQDSKYPHEKTIYYFNAWGSFLGFIHLIIAIWLLLHNRLNKKPREVIKWLYLSLIECIFFGFTTSLPLFL